MQETEPRVFLFGEPKIHRGDPDVPGIVDYLNEIGAPGWESDAGSAAEAISEVYGRVCYRSFAPGLNKNVTKVREGNEPYLANIINVGHGSVTEHAQVNFMFHDVSRVFTHELVRHRVGVAISQESLRYVRLDKLKAWVPSCLKSDPVLHEMMVDAIVDLERRIGLMLDRIFSNPEIEKDFELKKEFTSAVRRIAPIGLATSIGWSANIRTLRHVIEMRTSRHAEEEIRLVFGQVAEICIKRWPNFFSDYEKEMIKGHYEYTTKSRKI